MYMYMYMECDIPKFPAVHIWHAFQNNQTLCITGRTNFVTVGKIHMSVYITRCATCALAVFVHVHWWKSKLH